MARSIPAYLLLWLVLILAQVLICNHILLFGVAMPAIFLLIILRLPISMSLSLALTISFLTGATVDLFSDSAGVNAMSCCVVAMLRRPIFYLFMNHDEESETITPSVGSMGVWKYIRYEVTSVLLFFIISMSIVFFNYVHISDLAIRILSSTILTSLIILGIDSIFVGKNENKG